MFVVLRVSVRNDTSENELFYLLEVRHSTRGEKKKSNPEGFLTTLAFKRLREDGRTKNKNPAG